VRAASPNDSAERMAAGAAVLANRQRWYAAIANLFLYAAP